jgi:hypothetical protein
MPDAHVEQGPSMIRGRVRQVAALRWRTGGLLFAVVVIVALPYMITRGGSQQSLAAGELVTRSAEVQGLVYRIADQTHNSESAIQHLLADDPNRHAAATAQTAEKVVPTLLDELRRMAAGNPEQDRLVEQLGEVEGGRLALLHISRAIALAPSRLYGMRGRCSPSITSSTRSSLMPSSRCKSVVRMPSSNLSTIVWYSRSPPPPSC